MRLLASIAIVALALAATACGGDDGDDSDEGDAATATTQTETSGASGSASGAGGDSKQAPGVETPEELATCLEDSGYEPILVPPPDEGAPGGEFGSLGTVRVDLGSNKVVAAIVFETPGEAKEVAKSIFGQAAKTSKVIGPVFLATNRAGKKSREYEAFLACLRG